MNRVLQSVNSGEGPLCADFFRRPNGTFGFEEYRRDFEDAAGWYAIGGFAEQVHFSQRSAIAAARLYVGWFAEMQ